jgi:hypothetical protein
MYIYKKHDHIHGLTNWALCDKVRRGGNVSAATPEFLSERKEGELACLVHLHLDVAEVCASFGKVLDLCSVMQCGVV